MIYGIGTDIVAVARLERSLQRYGEPFAERILGPAELAAFRETPAPAQFLARRFTAKEAAAKALGTGFRDGIYLRDIRIAHDRLGRPGLEYAGEASRQVERRGITASHLSISDEREYAVAFVVLYRQ